MKSLYLVLVFTLIGCATFTLKFDEDPQIFNGKWKGIAFSQSMEIRAPVVSHDESLIAFSTYPTGLVVLESSTGNTMKRDPKNTALVLGFSSDNQSLLQIGSTDSGDPAIQIRDIATLQIKKTVATWGINPILSSDANWVLTQSATGDGRVTLTNLQQESTKTLQVSPAGWRYLSPHGKYIAVVNDFNNIVSAYYQIDLFSAEKGTQTSFQLPRSSGVSGCGFTSLSQLFFSDDETKVAAVLDGKRIQVWDIAQNKLLLNLVSDTCASGQFFSLDNNGSGSFIASNEISGTKIYWVDWNTTGSVNSTEIINLSDNQSLLTVLEAQKAYLIGSQADVYQAKLSRIGSSMWENTYSSKVAEINFNITAQKTNSNSYAFNGTAVLDGETFSVTGNGGGSGVRFSSVQSQTSPPMLFLSMVLVDTERKSYSIEAIGWPQVLKPGQKAVYSVPNTPSLSPLLPNGYQLQLERSP